MQQILLHFGVPDCVTPPRDLQGDHRVAVVFQPLAGCDELSIDEELFFDVMEGIGGLIAHESVAVSDDPKARGCSLRAERERYFAAPDEDRAFPERLDLYHIEARAASLVIEEWALVGGPPPYHDSYTLAVYTPVNMDNRDLKHGAVNRIIRQRYGDGACVMLANRSETYRSTTMICSSALCRMSGTAHEPRRHHPARFTCT